MDSKAECVRLNLAHVAREKYEKEETKTNYMIDDESEGR